jgi:hypothetical protein
MVPHTKAGLLAVAASDHLLCQHHQSIVQHSQHLLSLQRVYCCCCHCCCCTAEYGTKPWVNPVLSKALEIKASSPASRYTDPKVSWLVLFADMVPHVLTAGSQHSLTVCAALDWILHHMHCFWDMVMSVVHSECLACACPCFGTHSCADNPPNCLACVQALASGQFINTSFAGPRYVRAPPTPQPSPAALLAGHVSSSSSSGQPQPSTWWQLDLGPQHRLLCNYYVIRHDGSQEGFARSWALQVRTCATALA